MVFARDRKNEVGSLQEGKGEKVVICCDFLHISTSRGKYVEQLRY